MLPVEELLQETAEDPQSKDLRRRLADALRDYGESELGDAIESKQGVSLLERAAKLAEDTQLPLSVRLLWTAHVVVPRLAALGQQRPLRVPEEENEDERIGRRVGRPHPMVPWRDNRRRMVPRVSPLTPVDDNVLPLTPGEARPIWIGTSDRTIPYPDADPNTWQQNRGIHRVSNVSNTEAPDPGVWDYVAQQAALGGGDASLALAHAAAALNQAGYNLSGNG